MTYFSVIKLFLYWFGAGKIGAWLADLSMKRRPWISIVAFDSTGVRSMGTSLELQMSKGKHRQYFIVDCTTGTGELTSNRKKAATARALGMTVWVFNFNRYNNFIQFKSCNASVPGRNYNFLTDAFEGTVNESKDMYVQYFQTK